MITVPEIVRDSQTLIVACISGGKDCVAMTTELVEALGPERIVGHLEVLPLAWPEELPYVQEFCRQIGIPLVAQQMIYEIKPDTPHGVQRREIRDIHSPADIVPWDGKYIADLTDFALRRGWPPSSATRWCTGKFKTQLVDGWLVQERRAQDQEAIADVSDLALRRGWPPSAATRFCTSFYKRDLVNTWITANRQLGQTIVIALGERAAESPNRAKKPRLHFRGKERKSYTLLNWYPVHDWSRRQVFRRLRECGIVPFPAYQYQGMTEWQMYEEDVEGGPRTSCRCCIYSEDEQLCHQALMASNRPVFERLAYVEAATGRTWWPPNRRSATEWLSWADEQQVQG